MAYERERTLSKLQRNYDNEYPSYYDDYDKEEEEEEEEEKKS